MQSLKRLLCTLTTMTSMLTMADGGDDDSKVKIVQPSPTVLKQTFGDIKATKNHQMLLMATIYPCFYFCFICYLKS